MGLVSIENFDWEKLKLAKSGRAVKLIYDKEPLQICTSTLYSPFGVRSQNKEWSNFTEYSLDCSVNSSTSSDSSLLFKNFLEEFDIRLKKLLLDNIELFATAKGIDVEKVDYSPVYKQNGDYPKLFRFNLNRDKMGNFETFVFDSSKSKIKLTDDNITDTLSKGKPFKCIIECSRVWYFNEKVGSMWNAIQIKFSENKQQNLETTKTIESSTQNSNNSKNYNKGNSNNGNNWSKDTVPAVYNTMMID
jgi:hypothetical protein